MDGKKIYQIQINGIKESIDAVDALNRKLQALDEKISKMSTKAISVSTKGSGGSNTAALSEEVALEKEINKLKKEGVTLDAKIAATQDEVYKKVQATKDLYKETISDQKQLAAQERLTANAYSNTMMGMKQRLADLKTMINTTDLGDSDKLKKMTQEANELVNKLKEMEEAYGQFGRNVGNYKRATEGLTSYKVEIGGVVREFSSAREAARTLKNELMALPNGAEGAKELRSAIHQINSEMRDLEKSSKSMDTLLDTMEGFMAIANVGQGLRGLFGVDDAEIQKSIKNLVALQNVLKGIETLNKQISTREGIGGWIAPFNNQIDKATAKLLVFNSALLGTSKTAKVASVAIKGFSKALKLAFSAGILVAIDLLMEWLMKLVDSFKKVDEAAERAKKVQKDLAEAYGQAQGKLIQYKTKVDSFNGSARQEKKLVEDLNKEFGSTLGTYKSLSEWQDVLKKKGEAYIQTLINQAKAQAALNEVTAAYMNLEKVKQDVAAGKNGGWLTTEAQKRKKDAYDIEQANKRVEKAEKNLAKIIKENDKYAKENGIGNYAPQIKKNGTQTKNAIEQVNKTFTDLELRMMKDNLTKKLKQLDEEERQTINKLKWNGRKTYDEIKRVEATYSKARLYEINEYLKKLEETIQQKAREISKIKFEINIKDIDNQIAELQNKIDRIGLSQPIENTLITSVETKTLMKGIPSEKFDAAKIYENLFNEGIVSENGTKFYSFLLDYLKQKNEEVQKAVLDIYNTTDGDIETKQKAMFSKLSEMFEQEYSNELLIIRNYTQDAEQTLSQSFARRIQGERVYEDQILSVQIKSTQEQGKLIDKRLKDEKEYQLQVEKDRYDAAYKQEIIERNSIAESIKNFEVRNDKEAEALKKLKEKLATIDKQIEDNEINHSDKMAQINDEYNNKIIKNETDTANNVAQIQERAYNKQISNLRDLLSKINEEISKQPTINKFGIINLKATKNTLKEVKAAAISTLNDIRQEKAKLDRDYKNGLITPEVKNASISQLNDIERSIRAALGEIDEALKDLNKNFYDTVNGYLQAIGQTATQILSSLSEITSNQYQAQIEEQEKYIEQYEELLDKQKEATQKYADEVNSIEDELKTARGDRRQQLIDNLNAQMAAERASLAQEKKIEKEKEKAEEKKKKLEHDQAVAKKKMDLAQAYINAAMAVSMAAVNKWPVPAIPMMALAAAAGAAQIAAVASQNIPSYGSGGLLEGKSHKEGGIKASIGTSPIELEGQEFVIRKKTTTQNLALLDFINRSERKLNIDDFIDFYSSGKIKKSIVSASPKAKYADGGQVMPILRNDIDINNRLIDTMEAYANRPIYVAVTEIEDAQANVNYVRTLSGLNNE